MAPVVGKAIEVGLVGLYVATLTAALYSGTVPEYRATAGAEVGDRTLSSTVHEIERSVPHPSEAGSVERSITLPDEIHDEPYEICATDRTVALDHPHPEIGGDADLTLADRVESVSGCLKSTDEGRVVAGGNDSSVTVRLEDGDRR